MATTAPACLPGEKTFDCAVCFETFPTTQRIGIVLGDDVCHNCFTEHLGPQFLAALQHEHAHPVRWGPTKLDPALFTMYLPPRFSMKWTFKVREYATPVKERVYCAHLQRSMAGSGFGIALSPDAIESAVDEERAVLECGNFLGARAPPTSARATLTCISCKGHTCGLCSSSFFEHPTHHLCTDLVEKETADAFEGMVKGKDYQICPECAAPVELRDGCNPVFCEQGSCDATFCFVCGEAVARREVEHWMVGRPCPRWNQPGARNAHHDPAPPPVRAVPGSGAGAGAGAGPGPAPVQPRLFPPVGWFFRHPLPPQVPAPAPTPATAPARARTNWLFGRPPPPQQIPTSAPAPAPAQPQALPQQAGWGSEPLSRAAINNLDQLRLESIPLPAQPEPGRTIASITFTLSGDLTLNLLRIRVDPGIYRLATEVREFRDQSEVRHTLIEQKAQELMAALGQAPRGPGARVMDFRLSNGLFLYRERYPAALVRMNERLGSLEAAER